MATAREALLSAADQFEWEVAQLKKAGVYWEGGYNDYSYGYVCAIDAAVVALRERADDIDGGIKYTDFLLEGS